MKERKIKCPRCNYEWIYRGISFYAKCPRCKRDTPIKEMEAEINE